MPSKARFAGRPSKQPGRYGYGVPPWGDTSASKTLPGAVQLVWFIQWDRIPCDWNLYFIRFTPVLSKPQVDVFYGALKEDEVFPCLLRYYPAVFCKNEENILTD